MPTIIRRLEATIDQLRERNASQIEGFEEIEKALGLAPDDNRTIEDIVFKVRRLADQHASLLADLKKLANK